MKKYYVTVNGNRYEVEVEEVNGDFVEAPKPAPAVIAEPVSQKPAEPAPAPKPVKKDVPEGGEKIKCPMPGTIISVNVKEGDTVKEGDLLFILEAMKMENEIVSPVNGTVTAVEVAKGESVNTDDLLAVIK